MSHPTRARVTKRRKSTPQTGGDARRARATREEARDGSEIKSDSSAVGGRHRASPSHLLSARGDAAASRDAAHRGRNGPGTGSAADGGGGAQGAALQGCHCWLECGRSRGGKKDGGKLRKENFR